MYKSSTYLVTGATSGIGAAVARGLAMNGHRVLLGARTERSGAQAAEGLRAQVPGAELQVVAGDLSEIGQARCLAQQVEATTSRLQGIVLNAAEARPSRTTTVDGFETDFATNYLSGFVLTELLLPLLRASRPARIVTVSSSSHAHVKALDLDRLARGEDFHHARTYSATKLLNVLHVTALAPLLQGSGVTVNVADPGFVRTNLGRNATGGFAVFLKLASVFQAPPTKAAATPLFLLTSPGIQEVTGGYFTGEKPGRPSALSQDRALAADIRARTIELLRERRIFAGEDSA